MRAVDLARAVGISTQQIRNYLDDGILPAVTRSPSGYRLFTAAHLDALILARHLARGHGWPRTREIMRAVNQRRPYDALAIIDENHGELHRERRHLAEILIAVSTLAAGTEGTEASLRGRITIGQVARRTGVRRSALRVWENQGLLCPDRDSRTGHRSYSPADVRDAHIVVLLRGLGYRHPTIGTVLHELRASGSTERLQTTLSQRQLELAQRSRCRLEASAALHEYLNDGAAWQEHP